MNTPHRIVLFSQVSKRYLDLTYPNGYGKRIADKLVQVTPIGDCSENHDTFVVTADTFLSVVSVFTQMHRQAIPELSVLA